MSVEHDGDAESSTAVWAAFGDLMSVLLGVFALILVGVIAVQMRLSHQLDEEVRKREQAARQMRQKEVRRAIRDLTPDQQMVVSLKYLEDWSNEEIARLLHKPVGAVKSIQHRALVSLHKLVPDGDREL